MRAGASEGMLALIGLAALLVAAGRVQRDVDDEFWLPIAFGAVVILAYAWFTEVATAMGANP